MGEMNIPVLYKRRPALVVAYEEGKAVLEIGGAKNEVKRIKVREKDYVPLSSPCGAVTLKDLLAAAPPRESEISEAHELLLAAWEDEAVRPTDALTDDSHSVGTGCTENKDMTDTNGAADAHTGAADSVATGCTKDGEPDADGTADALTGTADSVGTGCTKKIDFETLCSIISSTYESVESYASFKSLAASRLFTLDEEAFREGRIEFFVNTQEEIERLEKAEREKQEEAARKAAFISRLKERKILESDAKYMAEVESVATGKSEASALMKAAAIASLPENAHRLLLETGVWNEFFNPYPARHGFSFSKSVPLPPPNEAEERVKIEHTAYAIDSASSTDPDDAVFFDGEYLWVHVADPASVVLPESEADKEARGRASTLYLPEKVMRMLDEKSLDFFALGRRELSPALSFRIKMDDDGSIAGCEVMKSLVKVKCITYDEAARRRNEADFAPLFTLAALSEERRRSFGAILVNMNEVHVKADGGKVKIETAENNEATRAVRELMIIAGTAAAEYAFERSIPFPFISQENTSDEPPPEIGGLAGEFALLKRAGKRSVSTQVAYHSAMALSMYTQVTSPLRRYVDLIAHEQLRAKLDGRKLITREEMFARVCAGEAAYVEARRAMRESEQHFKLVYLLQNPEKAFRAVCIDRREKEALLFLPELAMRTQITAPSLKLNEELSVVASDVDLPALKATFHRVD